MEFLREEPECLSKLSREELDYLSELLGEDISKVISTKLYFELSLDSLGAGAGVPF